MEGFFPTSSLITKAPVTLIPKCGACGLYKKCSSPKMKPSGDGRKEILIVGEAPGADEDRRGTQFVGKTGQRLRDDLRHLGISLRGDCWMTNSIICRPPKNETPTDKQVDWCLPNLRKTIQELNPVVVIPLGVVAVKAVLSLCWKESVGGISEWVGWKIPCQKWNCWICPTYHPSYVIREEDNRNPVPALLYSQHLASAVGLRGKPWNPIPDYAKTVERVYSINKAAGILRQMIHRGGTLAFDFETDRLKPDHPDARIVSCAVCWNGKKTIAYPFRGEAINATRELLRSPLPKIGAINKFEDRWSRAVLKTAVRNWYWDCCVGGHLADNRRGITSVKFQSFARLGLESYNDHIEPLLSSSEDSNSPNRIDEIEIDELLLYNGIDALVEYQIAMLQMAELNYPLPKG